MSDTFNGVLIRSGPYGLAAGLYVKGCKLKGAVFIKYQHKTKKRSLDNSTLCWYLFFGLYLRRQPEIKTQTLSGKEEKDGKEGDPDGIR